MADERITVKVSDDARANLKSQAALARMPMQSYITWLAEYAATHDLRPNAPKPDPTDTPTPPTNPQ